MKHIDIAIDDGVGTLTINRRERFNSLDVETARELRKAGLQLSRDTNVRAVILRGTDGVFCSGADLKEIRNAGRRYGDAFKEILEYIHASISEIRRAAKPWIAAVDGVAAAGGFGLAMCCDLVIASERATFEWAYGKTGLTGAESSTFFLPRLLGLRRAMQLVLLNPRLDARTALEWELITSVVPTETFDEEVRAVARQIAAGPTEALAIAKQLINQAAGVDRLDFHLDRELDNLTRIADGSNFSEGIDAFFEKRAPRFAVK
jgi:2-(1,2-epoxy-1,2-dihydrophenyl)acetyl-CoA isomerase